MELKDFVKDAIIKEGHGSGYYICGMPGTGKTATIRWIIRELQEEREYELEDGGFPEFNFLEINALKLKKPQEAYCKLYNHLYRNKKHVSWKKGLEQVEELFATHDPNRLVSVILIDELDYLVTAKQKVLYNFFDWPSRQHTKMVVLGVANTMDLPERLHPRIQSRIGLNRLEFPPYTKKQIKTIIEDRLQSLECFSTDAIKFCATKAAGLSGDIRRALQLCRVAAELRNNIWKDKGGKALVTVADIRNADLVIFDSGNLEIIKDLPLHAKTILTASVKLLRLNNLDNEHIYAEYDKICRNRGISPILSEHEVELLINHLECRGLLVKIRSRRKPWLFEVELCCDPNDVIAGVSEETKLSSIVQGLHF